MSFADEVALELSQIESKKNCCRFAFCAGFFFGADEETTETDTVLKQKTCRKDLADTLYAQFERQFGNHIDIVADGRYLYFTLCGASAKKMAERLKNQTLPPDIIQCENCRGAFLRGLFLSSGTVSDPEKTYGFASFTVPEEKGERAEMLLNFLHCPPTTKQNRKEKIALCYKNGTVIPELFANMGLHSLLFSFYNATIEKEIRNNENRATNCVAKNIERTVHASERQVELLSALLNSPRGKALPDNLKESARLRVENPFSTLEALTEMHKLPITKSGLYHRLKKLEEMAESQ